MEGFDFVETDKIIDSYRKYDDMFIAIPELRLCIFLLLVENISNENYASVLQKLFPFALSRLIFANIDYWKMRQLIKDTFEHMLAVAKKREYREQCYTCITTHGRHYDDCVRFCSVGKSKPYNYDYEYHNDSDKMEIERMKEEADYRANIKTVEDKKYYEELNANSYHKHIWTDKDVEDIKNIRIPLGFRLQ